MDQQGANNSIEVADSIARLRQLRHEIVLSRGARLGRRPVVGFLPTMGALHAGHGSLIERMAAECDVRIVSIFVNPGQFGPGEDFHGYPRTLEADLELCRSAGAELVFTPAESDFYAPGFETIISLPQLSSRWCGASRHGHFEGVATVVLKLLNLAIPDRAYFGEKDFQQLRIIKQLVRDMSINVEIVPCATAREADGLALSSRNSYLDAEQRRQAHELYGALAALREAFAGGEHDAAALQEQGRELLAASSAGWELEYLAVVDPQTLEPREVAQTGDRVLAAARLGGTRLIDNVEL